MLPWYVVNLATKLQACEPWMYVPVNVLCISPAGVFFYAYSQYGPGTGPVWLNNVNCIGVEQRLIDCPVISNNDAYCDHYNDAAVQCTGKKYADPVQSNSIILHFVATVQNCTDWDIRLVGGSSPLQGRVEVCYKNQWGTICGYDSVPTFANVICRQLGYSYYNPTVYYYSYFGMGSGGIYLYLPTLFCTGNETRLQNCYHTPLGYHQCYEHYEDIGVQCQGTFLNLNRMSILVQLISSWYNWPSLYSVCKWKLSISGRVCSLRGEGGDMPGRQLEYHMWISITLGTETSCCNMSTTWIRTFRYNSCCFGHHCTLTFVHAHITRC